MAVQWLKSILLRQDGWHFAEDIFKCIFLNEDTWILINISLRFVPKGLINNTPAWVQIMAWHQLGDKSLSEPMLVSLLMHTGITRPQCVNCCIQNFCWRTQTPLTELRHFSQPWRITISKTGKMLIQSNFFTTQSFLKHSIQTHPVAHCSLVRVSYGLSFVS